jgi:hypothetical protein
MTYFAIFIPHHITLSESIWAMRILRSTSLPIFCHFCWQQRELSIAHSSRPAEIEDRDVHCMTSRARTSELIRCEMKWPDMHLSKRPPTPPPLVFSLILIGCMRRFSSSPSDDLIKKQIRDTLAYMQPRRAPTLASKK